ncbi:Integrase core domain protein [Gimesia maris]|uniref:integrase core domain-containing protein n=1 Tax=Gimesia maris TaxID=122 RepID=UPI00118CF187|nr:integrase core domain-containing protein [Gimesia maris]QDT78605.1 Integrase core domain protein [Gimesia maris]
MVTSEKYRHVPTGTLARLAERLGKVFASPSTWYRLVRIHKWRRLQQRIYPAKPKVGIRATRTNEIWHVDTSFVRLVNGGRACIHAVIDNYSRRILAWRVLDRFEPGITARLFLDASQDTTVGTLWACDFFSKRAVTRRGLVDLYVLVFMHLETREVLATPSTRNPDSAWVTKQTKAFVNLVADREQKPTYLIHDRDKKFSTDFKRLLKNEGIQPKRLPIRSPNLNARVERFVQTIKYEALNHFIAFGQRYLDYLVSEFVSYYNKHRAHSSRENLPPCCAEPPPEFEVIKLNEIHCEEHLGGLIKSYERIAA